VKRINPPTLPVKSLPPQGNRLDGRGSSQAGVFYLLLSGLLGTWIPVFYVTLSSAIPATLALFLGVVFGGLWLCKRAVEVTGDSRLALLKSFWVLKLYLTLTLLYLGWIPDLDPATSRAWGYDPQRYYEFAWELLHQGFNPEGLEQNYQGVLYYYALLFGLLGRNPVIPALWNSFLTLAATTLLIRISLFLLNERSKRDWILVGLLLIPGLLWHDALTAKESILGPLLCLPVLLLAGHFKHPGRVSVKAVLSAWMLVAILVALARSTLLVPLAISGVLLLLLCPSRSRGRLGIGILVSGIIFFVVAITPWLAGTSGGYEFKFSQVLGETTKTADEKLLEQWSDRSLGKMLLPNNPVEAVAYLPFRSILMLAIPLPALGFTLEGLRDGSWFDYVAIMSVLDSVSLLAAFPLVLAGTMLAWRCRRKMPYLMVWPIVFWPLFLAVVGGLTILHERYRIVFLTPFYFCAWLGLTRGEPKKNFQLYGLWFGLLSSAYCFYIFYKRMF